MRLYMDSDDSCCFSLVNITFLWQKCYFYSAFISAFCEGWFLYLHCGLFCLRMKHTLFGLFLLLITFLKVVREIASSNPPVSSCGFISIYICTSSFALRWSGPALSFVLFLSLPLSLSLSPYDHQQKIAFWGHTWERTPLERLIIVQHSSSSAACGLREKHR